MNTLLCSTVLVLAFPVLSAFLDGSAKSRPLRLPRSPFVAGKHSSHFSYPQWTTNGFDNRPEEGLRSVNIIKENDVLDLLREKLGLCGDEPRCWYSPSLYCLPSLMAVLKVDHCVCHVHLLLLGTTARIFLIRNGPLTDSIIVQKRDCVVLTS
jgi:hypothetical protein